MTKIQTDEKKQHFDDIYVMSTPVPYKERILDELEYISDDFNREMFDAHILPWIETTTTAAAAGTAAAGTSADPDAQRPRRPIQFVDLCSCFGNTTMATVHGMSYESIKSNWSDETSCQIITSPRRFTCHVTGVDISAPALAYGHSVGLYDKAVLCDLNDRTSDAFTQTVNAMGDADVCISTAALVYLELDSIETLVAAFADGGGNDGGDDEGNGGYMLVNFLNPFALDKADKTKRILLKHLDFVASRATRHRRMSPLEQKNYPGEEWSLLELWVLKRKPKYHPSSP